MRGQKDNLSAGYRPSNTELMDPDSPYFTQDWWRICEILLPDSWAYIVSDFQWSMEFIDEAQSKKHKFVDIDVGHYPEATSPNERLNQVLSKAVRGFVGLSNQGLDFNIQLGNEQTGFG